MSAHLELVAVVGPAWVQDAGRPGHMAHGVPPGGALVPERLVAANRAVGNPGGSAAVEAFGGLVVAARGGDLRIAWDGVPAWLPRDHVRTLPPPEEGRVAYLAVAGGLDVPVVLGGRGLLLAAGFATGNVIRMSLLAREEEITIMRLVGASEAFILTPLLLEGAFLGLSGSLLALHRGAALRRRWFAVLAAIAVTVAASAFTVSGLWATHLFILVPLPQMTVAVAAAWLARSMMEPSPFTKLSSIVPDT